MLDKIDHLIIGGGMVYTLPKHKEVVWVGRFARMTIATMRDYSKKLIPKGGSSSSNRCNLQDFSNDVNQKVCKVGEIPDEWEGLMQVLNLKNFEHIVMCPKPFFGTGSLVSLSLKTFKWNHHTGRAHSK